MHPPAPPSCLYALNAVRRPHSSAAAPKSPINIWVLINYPLCCLTLLTCWAAHWKINANTKISSLNNISICFNKYFRFRLCRCCAPALFLHRAASCLPINSWEGCQLSVWQLCALLTNVLNSPNFEQLFKHNNCHLYTISALKHKIRLGNYQNVERNLAIIDSNVPKKRNWKLDNGALKHPIWRINDAGTNTTDQHTKREAERNGEE